MNNLLLVLHGSRIINRDYDSSHFIVPENFNIITFVKPNEIIYERTIKLLVTEFSNKSRNYFQKMNEILIESNLENRVKKIKNLEKEIIVNYLNDEIEKNKSLNEPLTIDEYGNNQFENFLFSMNLYQVNSNSINSKDT